MDSYGPYFTGPGHTQYSLLYLDQQGYRSELVPDV